MKIGILEPSDFSKKALDDLGRIGEVSLYNNEEITDFVTDKEVLFVRLKHYIGLDILSAAKSLKFICSPTTGHEHIALKELEAKRIKLISLKGEQEFLTDIRATPEHTIGLVLALIRNYYKAFLSEKNQSVNRDDFKGTELFKSSIGLIGFGRVGKLLAKYLEAFEANVTYYDIDQSISPHYSARKIDQLKDLISNADIIILCASLRPGQDPIINSSHLDSMQDKYFINTSRGELVDEKYLINKIRADHFKGIALDVITDETGDNKHINEMKMLTEGRNFILTPHIGGATYESMEKTEEFIANKLIESLKDK